MTADAIPISGPQMLMLIIFFLMCGYGAGRAANRFTKWQLVRAQGQRDTLYRELVRTREKLTSTEGELARARHHERGLQ